MPIPLSSLLTSVPANRARRYRGVIAAALVACSVVYAAGAVWWTPGSLGFADAVKILIASTVPPLLVAVVLCWAHPRVIDRRLLRTLAWGIIATGALVALLPAALSGGM